MQAQALLLMKHRRWNYSWKTNGGSRREPLNEGCKTTKLQSLFILAYNFTPHSGSWRNTKVETERICIQREKFFFFMFNFFPLLSAEIILNTHFGMFAIEFLNVVSTQVSSFSTHKITAEQSGKERRIILNREQKRICSSACFVMSGLMLLFAITKSFNIRLTSKLYRANTNSHKVAPSQSILTNIVGWHNMWTMRGEKKIVTMEFYSFLARLCFSSKTDSDTQILCFSLIVDEFFSRFVRFVLLLFPGARLWDEKSHAFDATEVFFLEGRLSSSNDSKFMTGE